MSNGYSSQFLGSFPVGSVIQSPANINDPSWLRLDGSIITRASYPALSALMPGVGTFTPTSRTLAATPAASAMSVNGANIVVPGASGASAVQYSSNAGVSWTLATTPASFSVNTNGLIYTGTNFFALGGPANTGIYSPSGTGSGAWTASTGITSGPTTCATNGAGTILAPAGGSMNISTNNGATFSSYSFVGAGGAGSPIVYTGTQWLLFCGASGAAGQGLQTSTTGLVGSWNPLISPPWDNTQIYAACSDGAGNVLAVSAASSVAWASNNNGTTWRQTLLPSTSAGSCSYANGRWFVASEVQAVNSFYSDGSCSVSSDLQSWVTVPLMGTPDMTNNQAAGIYVGYSGGNYIAIGGGVSLGSTLLTSTENATQLYLPASRRQGMVTNFSINSIANWQEWIKAA